jgi:hypothetical protein
MNQQHAHDFEQQRAARKKSRACIRIEAFPFHLFLKANV